MKLGCFAHDYGRLPAGKLASKLQSVGYTAVQLVLSKALSEVDANGNVTPEQAHEIGGEFQARGMEITVLGCAGGLSDPDAGRRQAAVEQVKRCLALQKPLGAKLVGTDGFLLPLGAEERAGRVERLTDSILRVVEEAARQDGVFAVEPVSWHTLDSIGFTAKLLARVADPVHLKLIFDPANILRDEELDRQALIFSSWLNVLGNQVAVMHIKDFRLEGNARVPTPLGKGMVDYAVLSQWLRQNRPELPLLREGAMLEHDQEDLRFMAALVQ